jgi:uncharacterized protein (TIGR03000 family)
MYSVVLLMAVTTGGESAELGRRGGGCHGCYGGFGGGCYGGGWGGGCYGGGCYGGGGLFGGRHGRRGHGCHGGWGCYGGGWGCYGGGYGGCYGGVVMGGYGGGCYGGGVVMGGYGGYGCTGGTVIIGGPPHHPGPGPGPGVPMLTPDEDKWLKEMLGAEKDEKKREELRKAFLGADAAGRKKMYDDFKKGEDKGDAGGAQVSTTNGQATIVVSLPASASLSFNGQSVGASTSTKRTFVSPDLVAGRAYTYDLKADYRKDGRTVSVSRTVQVEAGKTVNVDLTGPRATAVASR